MVVAENKIGKTIHIKEIKGDEKDLYCPVCHCPVIPAALSSKKVRPYFRAVTGHKDECPYKVLINTPGKEADEDRLDFMSIWNQMFPEKKGSIAVERTASEEYEEHLRGRTIHEDGYLQEAVRAIYKKCKSLSPSDYLGNSPVKEIYCGRETAYIYTTFVSGRKLMECSFLQYDREKKSIYFGFPYGSTPRMKIRAKFWDESNLSEAIRLTYAHKGVILLFSHFSTLSKDFIRCDIKNANQVICA